MARLFSKIEAHFRDKRRSIFVFGPPQAGKSTLLAALIAHVNITDGVALRRDPIKNKDGVAVIRRLLGNVEENKFPLQTPESQYVKVRFGFEDLSKKSSTYFEFFEIAGEDTMRFDPLNPDHDNIPDDLQKFLDASHGIMLVAPSVPATQDERESFSDFLEVLRERGYRGKLALVLTKYDMAAASFSSEVEAAKAIYRSTVDLLYTLPNTEIFSFSAAPSGDENLKPNYKSATGCSDIMEWLARL